MYESSPKSQIDHLVHALSPFVMQLPFALLRDAFFVSRIFSYFLKYRKSPDKGNFGYALVDFTPRGLVVQNVVLMENQVVLSGMGLLSSSLII
jgi:hypothetical protein